MDVSLQEPYLEELKISCVFPASARIRRIKPMSGARQSSSRASCGHGDAQCRANRESKDVIRWSMVSGWKRPVGPHYCCTAITTSSRPTRSTNGSRLPSSRRCAGTTFTRGALPTIRADPHLMKAVEQLMQRDGRLPVNVRFLIEGEEEVGGEHIEQFVQSKDPRLQADAR